jgi:hypothetical protein
MNLIEYLNIYLFFTQTKTRQKNKGLSGFPNIRGMRARLDLADHSC